MKVLTPGRDPRAARPPARPAERRLARRAARASRRCAPRSAGATTCSTRPRRRSSSGSACSPAASRSRPPRRSAVSTRSTASPRWSSTACSPAAVGRFEMLETVREYAHDRLAAGGELDDGPAPTTRGTSREVCRRRRARHRERRRSSMWLERLHAERDNVRAAIGFAVAAGDAASALMLCASTWRYWLWRGSLVEGRELIDRRAGARRAVAPALRQRALNARRRAGRRAGRLPGRDAAVRGEPGARARARRRLPGRARRGQPRQHGAVRARLRRGDRALRALDGVLPLASTSRAALSLMTQNLGIALLRRRQPRARGRAADGERRAGPRRRRPGAPHARRCARSARLRLDEDDPTPRRSTLLHEALELSRDLMERPGSPRSSTAWPPSPRAATTRAPARC